MDPYAKVVGGGLSLKNGARGHVNRTTMTDAKVSKDSTKSSLVGTEERPKRVLPRTGKTAAELAFQYAQEKRQAEKIKELASKSHKEKVAQYNEYLGKLSEHHDIPKVP